MGNPSMSLLGQEGLVSHLPSLICEKKSLFIYLFIYLFFYFEGENSFIFVLKGERCVDM